MEKPTEDWEGVKSRMCRRCGKLEARPLEKKEYRKIIVKRIAGASVFAVILLVSCFLIGTEAKNRKN